MVLLKLQSEYIGKGETKNFIFKQILENEKAYIYSVNDEGKMHFEVFLKMITPICVDFKNKIYSQTHFKEIYPNSKKFGISAWTYSNYEQAIEKFKILNNNE